MSCFYTKQILSYRKTQIADKHSRTTLLRKYFIAWHIWVRSEQERRELEQAQNNTRNKMMSLLEAAATGKLWQGREDDLETERSTSRSSSKLQGNNSARGSRDKKSTAEKIVSISGMRQGQKYPLTCSCLWSEGEVNRSNFKGNLGQNV